MDFSKNSHVTLWAAFLLAFFGFLRKSNIAPPAPHLFDPTKHISRSSLHSPPMAPYSWIWPGLRPFNLINVYSPSLSIPYPIHHFVQSPLSNSCYPEYLPLPTAPRSCFRRGLRQPFSHIHRSSYIFDFFCHKSARIPVSIPAIRSGVADAVLLGLPASPLNYSKLTAIGVQTPSIATSPSHLVNVTGLPSKWLTTCLSLYILYILLWFLALCPQSVFLLVYVSLRIWV